MTLIIPLEHYLKESNFMIMKIKSKATFVKSLHTLLLTVKPMRKLSVYIDLIPSKVTLEYGYLDLINLQKQVT